ncbi:hypothetical protein BUL45_13095 [Clostridium perfringens]|nr:hypothetical protein [Clostridium perfringens]
MSIVCCPICNNEANIDSDKSYVCKCCGRFGITEEAIEDFKEEKYKLQAAKVSAILKHREIKKLPKLTIFSSAEEASKQGNKCIAIEDLLISYPNKIKSRLDSVLINLSELSNYTGEYINLDKNG